VDDLLADFLNPAPSDLAQLLKMEDILSPFSGGGEEELQNLRSPASTLAPTGLAAGMPPPAQVPQNQNQQQAQEQQQHQQQAQQQQYQQYAQQQHQLLMQMSPGGSHGEGGCAGGSGSVISHDTPTSSGGL
jgi:transcription initiation factor TFIID subunit TAF12